MTDKTEANKDKKKSAFQSMLDEKGKAATIAVRNIFNPDAEHLVEVANISVGALHSLTMLQAYGEHVSILVEQIRAVQKWYTLRHVRHTYMTWNAKGRIWEYNKGCSKETCQAKYEEQVELLETFDPLDIDKLFTSHFRKAYYQQSRGKEGKLLEIGEVLADTDLQTRTMDMEDQFRNPIRSQ